MEYDVLCVYFPGIGRRAGMAGLERHDLVTTQRRVQVRTGPRIMPTELRSGKMAFSGIFVVRKRPCFPGFT